MEAESGKRGASGLKVDSGKFKVASAFSAFSAQRQRLGLSGLSILTRRQRIDHFHAGRLEMSRLRVAMA